MTVLDCVRQTIQRRGLASPETRVLVALSGGSDSVALTCLLRTLEQEGALRVAGLAHFNHQLRAAADRDEQFCANLASREGLPLIVDRADVARLAQSTRTSLENAARTARHAFFERARLACGADVVAVGHTKDDQAETFLLRLLRGAGAKGLGAMHPRAGLVIRPLLECRRRDLRMWLESRGVPFVHDESNDDVSIPRNRVRAELLPLLVDRFNPSIVDVLSDEAAIARDEDGYLESLAADWWARHGRADGPRRIVDVAPLSALPDPLARRVLRRAMVEVAGGRAVGFGDVERAIRLARSDGAAFDAPGQRLERIAGEVVLTGRFAGNVGRRGAPRPTANLFRYLLSIPGEVEVPDVGQVLSAQVVSTWDEARQLSGSGTSGQDRTAVVQLGSGVDALAVRNRRAGDRFQPLGLNGRKKLQDYFVDRKIVRADRDRVPLVVDASDRIVWVAGHTIDAMFRVTDPAQHVIILRLKGVGGSA